MSRNPILSDKAFGETSTTESPSPAQEWDSAQQAGVAVTAQKGQTQFAGDLPAPAGSGRVMTLGGVSAATLFIFTFLLIGAAYGWTLVTEKAPVLLADGTQQTPVSFDSPVLLLVCLIGAFGISMLTVFKPKLARFTALPYGLLEGAVLGMISHYYNAQFQGIVVQAILATFGVFLAMLVMYGLRILRATPKFTKGVIGATFGIMIMYLFGFVLSLFTNMEPPWQGGGLLSIGISVVIVIVASLNLILDFDFIERGSKNNLPAYMDWYAAFGLILTLVWLYLEMLRLLSKIRQ
ncbi:MAG: Bax inhibitor-1/YccA family protein [Microthrixaceae bacterium]